MKNNIVNTVNSNPGDNVRFDPIDVIISENVAVSAVTWRRTCIRPSARHTENLEKIIRVKFFDKTYVWEKSQVKMEIWKNSWVYRTAATRKCTCMLFANTNRTMCENIRFKTFFKLFILIGGGPRKFSSKLEKIVMFTPRDCDLTKVILCIIICMPGNLMISESFTL